MRFWDSSAIAPLLVEEPSRERAVRLAEDDPLLVVWWATVVECTAAIARRERDGSLRPTEAKAALADLRAYAEEWHEVAPSEQLRTVARRLLRTHSLRAGDALQLAAGIVAAEGNPGSIDFVCLDDRLTLAAEREGFRVLGP